MNAPAVKCRVLSLIRKTVACVVFQRTALARIFWEAAMKITIGCATAIAGTAVLAVLVTSGFSPARAQNSSYPTRTITIIVPFPPGGTADMLPRVIAQKHRVI